MITNKKELLDYVIELTKNELQNQQATQNNLIAFLAIFYTVIVGFMAAQTFTSTLSNFFTGFIKPFLIFGPTAVTIAIILIFIIIMGFFIGVPTAINAIITRKDRDTRNLHKILQIATKYKYNWEIIPLGHKKNFIKFVKEEFSKHDNLKDIKIQYE